MIGVVSRESAEVKAQTWDKFTFVEMKAFLEKHVNFEKATLYTDDFTAYKPFKNLIKHETVNHSHKEYARGQSHTNTIEGFWSLLKRGIVG